MVSVSLEYGRFRLTPIIEIVQASIPAVTMMRNIPGISLRFLRSIQGAFRGHWNGPLMAVRTNEYSPLNTGPNIRTPIASTDRRLFLTFIHSVYHSAIILRILVYTYCSYQNGAIQTFVSPDSTLYLHSFCQILPSSITPSYPSRLSLPTSPQVL
jgi:hypothetical protein